jgi:hypothetical protein
MIGLASFLAGALLSILLPIALLIGLAIWHTVSLMHVPDRPAVSSDVKSLETGAAQADSAAREGTTTKT